MHTTDHRINSYFACAYTDSIKFYDHYSWGDLPGYRSAWSVWVVGNRRMVHDCLYHIENTPGPLFTKWTDVLPQDLAKYWIWEIYGLELYDRSAIWQRLGSTAVEKHVKFHGRTTILILNLAASRLRRDLVEIRPTGFCLVCHFTAHLAPLSGPSYATIVPTHHCDVASPTLRHYLRRNTWIRMQLFQMRISLTIDIVFCPIWPMQNRFAFHTPWTVR